MAGTRSILQGALMAGALLVGGCPESQAPLDASSVDARVDASDATESRVAGLDVIFLMRESVDEPRLRERLSLYVASALPAWFEAVPDLRLAVLGSNLGIGTAENRFCRERGGGGALRRETRACESPAYFVDRDTMNAERELGCRLFVSGYCGIEQPLEATLAALSTEAEPYRFFGDTRTEGDVGLGDTTNAGFRRADVPLLLVIPTTEDDCSFMSRGFFTDLTENFRVRCAEQSEGLYPVDLYADALSELAPAGLHVFFIAGVPTDLVGASAETVASDPRMAYTFDPMTQQPVISCRSESLGRAFPPTRLAQFASELVEREQNQVYFGSMCDDAALEASFARLGEFVIELGTP